jgi:hypothetical protein
MIDHAIGFRWERMSSTAFFPSPFFLILMLPLSYSLIRSFVWFFLLPKHWPILLIFQASIPSLVPHYKTEKASSWGDRHMWYLPAAIGISSEAASLEVIREEEE